MVIILLFFSLASDDPPCDTVSTILLWSYLKEIFNHKFETDFFTCLPVTLILKQAFFLGEIITSEWVVINSFPAAFTVVMIL